MDRNSEIRMKRRILRELYGGTMTCNELRKEIGGSYDFCRRWALEHGLAVRIGDKIRYDVDALAVVLVDLKEEKP